MALGQGRWVDEPDAHRVGDARILCTPIFQHPRAAFADFAHRQRAWPHLIVLFHPEDHDGDQRRDRHQGQYGANDLEDVRVEPLHPSEQDEAQATPHAGPNDRLEQGSALLATHQRDGFVVAEHATWTTAFGGQTFGGKARSGREDGHGGSLVFLNRTTVYRSARPKYRENSLFSTAISDRSCFQSFTPGRATGAGNPRTGCGTLAA